MDSRAIELLTEIMDLLGGVSVAPELIGKERLEALRERIKKRAGTLTSAKITRRATSRYGSEDPRIYKPVLWTGISVAVMLVLRIYSVLPRIGVERRVWQVLLTLLLGPIIAVLGYWSWLALLVAMVFVFEILLDGLLFVPLWVANRASLSRTLLIMGFALFVASKVMTILRLWLSKP